MSTEIDLISRLSAATGPSRELDGEIALANGWTQERDRFVGDCWKSPRGRYQSGPPRFTESIDAALTLVPEGYGFMIRYHETADGKMRACCSLLGCNGVGDTWDVWGNTPAIAIAIACLKAKEDSNP